MFFKRTNIRILRGNWRQTGIIYLFSSWHLTKASCATNNYASNSYILSKFIFAIWSCLSISCNLSESNCFSSFTEFNYSLSMLLFLSSSYISLTISIMVAKSSFKSSSNTLVKKEEFEDSLVGVAIISMNKRTSNKINKELIQQPFATNHLCFKDCLEFLWDKKNAFSPYSFLSFLEWAINRFPFISSNSDNSQSATSIQSIRQSILDYPNTFQTSNLCSVNQAFWCNLLWRCG